jgi:ankyrin repeat protein
VTNAADLDELHHAIKRGDLLALRTYLERGGSIVATDRYGWTPLLMAAKQGHTPMVHTLLEAGADPNGGFESGFTPLVAAAISGSRESVEALLAAGADPSVTYGRPLIEIMRQQGRSSIVQLLEVALAQRGRAV